MKYAVTHPRLGATHVVASYPFAWMARLHYALFRRANTCIHGVEVAQITQDPVEIIRICEHRDQTLARLRTLAEQHQDALQLLAGLVSRDEDGNWTTVHPADTLVPGDFGALLA
jgi:hypothetical protein